MTTNKHLCESCAVAGIEAPATGHSTNPDWSRYWLCDDCIREYNRRFPVDSRKENEMTTNKHLCDYTAVDLEQVYGYEIATLLSQHNITIYMGEDGEIIEHGSGPIRHYSLVTNADPLHLLAANIDNALDEFGAGRGEPWLFNAINHGDNT